MHRVGLIGGLSWAASAEYYSALNREARARLGGAHSADLLLRSLDFGVVLKLADDRAVVEDLLYEAAQDLIRGGGVLLALASFTAHSYARRIRGIAVPLIDLANVVRDALEARQLPAIGVLATGRSLQDALLMDMISGGGAIEILSPPPDRQAEIDRIIFEELALGRCGTETVAVIDAVVADLLAAGAPAVLLATTEFSPIRGRLARQDALMDATTLHCGVIAEHMFRATEGVR